MTQIQLPIFRTSSTLITSELERSAATMFTRWSQGNFFKYMREHQALDRLFEHESAPLLRSAHPFGLPVGRLCRSARLLKPRATSIPPACHLRDQRQPAPRPRPQRTTRRKPRPSQPPSTTPPLRPYAPNSSPRKSAISELLHLVYRPIRSTVFPTGQDL